MFRFVNIATNSTFVYVAALTPEHHSLVDYAAAAVSAAAVLDLIFSFWKEHKSWIKTKLARRRA
jgi:hypothetical protein